MKNDAPLISIIIPVYNVSKYIRFCIESILNQTYRNLEIILIDDGSTDDSGTICEELKETDSRIIVIHKENGGAASARNAGLDSARGEYISFIDADDWIDSSLYEDVLDVMNDNNAEIACFGCMVEFDSMQSKGQCFPVSTRSINRVDGLRSFLRHEEIGYAIWDKLYKADLFKTIRFPEGMVDEDIPINVDTILRANNICLINQSYYHYRVRNDSVTSHITLNHIMDRVHHCRYIFNEIKNQYPILSNDALRLYSNSLISALEMARDNTENPKYEFNNIKEECISACSQCEGLKYKLIFVLLKINLYFPLLCIYKSIKSKG